MRTGRTPVDLIKEASAIVRVAAELADDREDITRRALEGAMSILSMATLLLESPVTD